MLSRKTYNVDKDCKRDRPKLDEDLDRVPTFQGPLVEDAKPDAFVPLLQGIITFSAIIQSQLNSLKMA